MATIVEFIVKNLVSQAVSQRLQKYAPHDLE